MEGDAILFLEVHNERMRCYGQKLHERKVRYRN